MRQQMRQQMQRGDMERMRSTVVWLVGGAALVGLMATAAPAQESTLVWPQWRGPDRDGIAKESGWKVEPGGDPIWTREFGLGYSTVSLGGGRMFTMGHDPEAQTDTVFCVDPLTGEDVWTHTFDAPTMAKAHTGGTLSTPSLDGDLVYVTQRMGRFFCFDAATGKVVFEKDLTKQHGLTVPTWGFAAAPLILDDQIIVNMGKVISFDKKGVQRWVTKDYGHAYSTPTTFEHDGRACLAVFCGDGLIVLDEKKGTELAVSEWKTRYDVNAASPVVIGDKIFISSGYGTGCSMLRFDGDSLETLWTNKEMRNHMSGCVYFEGHLYGFDETFLKCMDLDGNVLWSQRGLGKGALLLADGKILALTGRGELVIAEAKPEEFVELSRQKVLEGGRQWTTPVLVGGYIFCRNSQGAMVCVDRRGDAGDR